MSRRNARAGTSLIEVIIAAAIFAVLALSLTHLSLSVDRASAHASERRTALSAANRQLQELKLLSFPALLQRNGLSFPVAEIIDNNSIALRPDPAAGPDGEVWTEPGRVFVTPIGAGDFLQVVIYVRWRSVAGPGQVRVVWGRAE